MSPKARVARQTWLAYWNLMRRYHRYEVRGLENLESLSGPAVIVSYHARAFAQDLCMLQALLVERGRPMPVAVVHSAITGIPLLRHLVEGMEFIAGEPAAMSEAVRKGRSIIVTPGGTREACRSFRYRYQLDWGDRLGYLKAAVQLGLPIVPAAASGVDDTFVGLLDGYVLGKALRIPKRISPWIGFGPLGPWPFSPPFPVKIVQFLGTPVRDHLEAVPGEGGGAASGEARLRAVDRRVRRCVENLLTRAIRW
jgi:1-acyl-sn-glycerol-3-phosphate acyltransferase